MQKLCSETSTGVGVKPGEGPCRGSRVVQRGDVDAGLEDGDEGSCVHDADAEVVRMNLRLSTSWWAEERKKSRISRKSHCVLSRILIRDGKGRRMVNSAGVAPHSIFSLLPPVLVGPSPARRPADDSC